MSFKNVEKKIEITFKQGAKSLKILPRSFWETLASKAKVRILSSVNSPLCDSYILSESSLFVFPQKLILMTSGQSSLVPVVEFILSNFKLDEIDSFFYEVRGCSYESTFLKEVLSLSRYIPGTLINLGESTSHQVSLFYMDRPATLLKNSEATFEVLIHKLDSKFQEVFSLDKASVRKVISENQGFKGFFDSFDVQDFSFQPFGYSLNAMKGDKYFTLHVSPRERASLACLETNFTEFGAEKLLGACFSLFQPESLQFVAFSPHKEFLLNTSEDLKLKNVASKRLANGFLLQYFDFQTSFKESVLEEIEISKSITHQSTTDSTAHVASQSSVIEATPRLTEEEPYKNEDLSIFGEMFSHVPLFIHPNPFRVLVAGDSTLSIIREVLKHESVQECTLVHKEVLNLEAFAEDPRLSFKVQSLRDFVQEPEHQYDVILISQTQSLEKREELFSKMKDLLAPGGVFVCEAPCPLTKAEDQRLLKAELVNSFSKIFFYNSARFSSEASLRTFAYASDNYHPVEEFDREKALKSKINFYYYNSEIHYACFFLPSFMRHRLAAERSDTQKNLESSADLSV